VLNRPVQDLLHGLALLASKALKNLVRYLADSDIQAGHD